MTPSDTNPTADSGRFTRRSLLNAFLLVVVLVLAACQTGSQDPATPTPSSSNDTSPTPTPTAAATTEPTIDSLSTGDAVDAVRARLEGLARSVPAPDADRAFLHRAIASGLTATCEGDSSDVELQTGQCYVTGPGVVTAEPYGLQPNLAGVWYVWAENGAILISTERPGAFASSLPGESFSHDLEDMLNSDFPENLVALSDRCTWVLDAQTAIIQAAAIYEQMAEFRDTIRQAAQRPAEHYADFKDQLKRLGTLAPPANADDESWAAQLDDFFEKTDHALASLVVGWQAANSESVTLGESLYTIAQDAKAEPLATLVEYEAFATACRTWHPNYVSTSRGELEPTPTPVPATPTPTPTPTVPAPTPTPSPTPSPTPTPIITPTPEGPGGTGPVAEALQNGLLFQTKLLFNRTEPGAQGTELRTISPWGANDELFMTYPTGACNHRWSNDASKIAIFERLSSGFFGFVIRDTQGTLISEQQRWVDATCDLYAVWPHYNDDVILVTRNGGVIEHWVATGETTESTLQNVWDLPNEGEFRGIDLSPVTETYVLATDMNGTWDIFTRLGTDNLRVTAANENQPRWSPSGTHVVFTTDKDGTNDIYVMNVEDGSLRVITVSDADDVDPIWSPDGNWIVFASNRNGNYDLYLASATGGESQALLQITTSPLDDRHPEWEPIP